MHIVFTNYSGLCQLGCNYNNKISAFLLLSINPQKSQQESYLVAINWCALKNMHPFCFSSSYAVSAVATQTVHMDLKLPWNFSVLQNLLKHVSETLFHRVKLFFHYSEHNSLF